MSEEITDFYEMYKKVSDENSMLKIELWHKNNSVFSMKNLFKDTISWIENHAILLIIVCFIIQVSVGVFIDIMVRRT